MNFIQWKLAHPQMLLLAVLPAILFLFFLLWPRSHRRGKTIPFSAPLSLMKRQAWLARWGLRSIFIGTVIAFVGLSWIIARPVERESWTEKSTDGIDIVITLDVSESMDADDFHPSRILVAKSVITDFIRKRKNDRIGLVVFGGEAVTKSPLTRDQDFLYAQVDAIQLRELKQGTAIGMGLANALLRLKDSKSKTKIIVLLTDGDSNVGAVNPITAANLARQEGIKIYTIGIGQKNRVIIPIYQYDSEGHRLGLIARIPSYINPALLREIAQLTGGKAYMARDSGMLNRILQEIDSLEKTKIKMTAHERQEEKYWIPALILTVLLFLFYVLQETRFRLGGRRYVSSA